MRRALPVLLGVLLFGYAAGWLHGKAGVASSREPAGSEGSGEGIEQALLVPDASTRAQRLANAISRGEEISPDRLSQFLAGGEPRIGAVEWLLLLRGMAERDPISAADLAAHLPLTLRAAAMELVTEIHATADPQAALRQLSDANASSFGKAVEALLEDAVVRGWVASGEPGVEDYIRDLGIGFARQRALSVYARERIRRGDVAALQRWAESLPDEPQRFKRAAFRQISSELAVWDPALGVAWCEAHCDGPFGLSIRQLVGMRWAARDGRAALEWLAGYPEDPTYALAIRDAFWAWHRQNPEAALAYVAELELDPASPSWFRPAVGLYAQLIAVDDPVEALRWALGEEDAQRREANVISIVRDWRSRDEAAAERWLEAASLPADVRERARRPPATARRADSRAAP